MSHVKHAMLARSSPVTSCSVTHQGGIIMIRARPYVRAPHDAPPKVLCPVPQPDAPVCAGASPPTPEPQASPLPPTSPPLRVSVHTVPAQGGSTGRPPPLQATTLNPAVVAVVGQAAPCCPPSLSERSTAQQPACSYACQGIRAPQGGMRLKQRPPPPTHTHLPAPSLPRFPRVASQLVVS